MTYMLWMITDMKKPLPENLRLALEHHEKKYGKAPNIVEHGIKEDMPNIDGVRYVHVRIPANILLLAVE